MRERLPNTRQSITHKLVLSHTMPSGKAKRLHIYITVGLYDDGRPAELFYRINKADDTISGFCKMWAIAVSLCLQSGVTLEKLVEKFAFQDFPPNGFTENKDLRSCKSICDYTIRWMEKEFSKEKS